MSDFYGKYNGHMWSHLVDCRKQFKDDQIVMLALTGSQNYNLDTPASDMDTKLTVLPTLEDIISNKPAVSTTHIREDKEHTDFKDLRLMLPTLLKQNVNYVEQLFATQYIINQDYEEEIEELKEIREEIARFCPTKCIMTMYGIAMNKQGRIFRELPDKKDIFTFGYNPKEAMQLFRIEEFMQRYIDGEPFANCLITQQREQLLLVKCGGFYNANQMLEKVNEALNHVETLKENYITTHENTYNPTVAIIVHDIQKQIMMKYLKKVVK